MTEMALLQRSRFQDMISIIISLAYLERGEVGIDTPAKRLSRCKQKLRNVGMVFFGSAPLLVSWPAGHGE